MMMSSVIYLYWKPTVTKGEVVLFHAINVYFGVAFKLHLFLTLTVCDHH